MITVSLTFSFDSIPKARAVALSLREDGYRAQSDKILNAIHYQHTNIYTEGGVVPTPEPEPAPEPAGPIDCDHRVFGLRWAKIGKTTDSTVYVGTTELKEKERQLAEHLHVGETVTLEDNYDTSVTITRSN